MASKRKPRTPAKTKVGPTSPNGPRILTLDIETAPIAAHTWGIWDQNIGINQIVEDTAIICVAWRWYGEEQTYSFHTGGRGKARVRDDKKLIELCAHLLDEADIVVTQNGTSFDIKRINSRMLFYGMTPYSPVRQVDTKLVAKKHFAMTSNKLEYMADKFAGLPKSKHHEFPGFDLWTECMKDNPRAWKEMAAYNERDVEATELLYVQLVPWIDQHPNVCNFDGSNRGCPKCGTFAENLERRGFARTQLGKYQRFQCNECGGWSRSRVNLNDKETRGQLLAN